MKAFFRAISFAFAVIAFVILVIDGTSMIASKSLAFTPTAEVVARFVEPATLERWQAAVAQLHPFVWRLIDTILLSSPALVTATVLALAFWAIGRRSEPDFDMQSRRD